MEQVVFTAVAASSDVNKKKHKDGQALTITCNEKILHYIAKHPKTFLGRLPQLAFGFQKLSCG